MTEGTAEGAVAALMLQREIARRSRQGWQVITQTSSYAQMRKPKRFSFPWFLFWLVISFGFLFWLYPVYHWSKKDNLMFVQVENGQLLADGRITKGGDEGTVEEVIVAGFRWAGTYWRWAKHEGIVIRVLSIVIPILTLSWILLIIIAILSSIS